MYSPTLETARTYAGEYRCVPVCRTILSDRRTPIEVLKVLKNNSRHCYMLESLESTDRWGRYTFLGFDPQLELTCVDGQVRITENGTIRTEQTRDPGAIIRAIVADHKSPRIEGFPTFTGGLVGYFSYDFIKYAEPNLQLDAEDQEHFNDIDLMLFDKVICFDNLKQKIILIANASTENLDESYPKAIAALDEMAALIKDGAPAEIPPLQLKSDFRRLFDKEQYCAMVEKARHYIYEGDIFQVVLSNPMTAAAEGSLLDVYRLLRTTNPSPYMFFFVSDDIELAGASPETLTRLDGGVVKTFPLAGTRPRGATTAEDEALEADLLADEKELAEHNMLVDLGRNDLGRVCELGSVTVDKYLSIHRFSHVMHIGSDVSGRIADGFDAVDAIDAILPAGTLSGAPKLRAAQIIQELEGAKRGIYGGAIGYLDFAGNMDTCISIRLAYKKDGRVCVQAGAGIVADSVPDKEFAECRNKARAVTSALTAAEGGVR